jgi:hypothetical protein
MGYARAGTWTTLDYPGAWVTEAFGISGNSIVGVYWDNSFDIGKGFLYNGASWTALNHPWAVHGTYAECRLSIANLNKKRQKTSLLR